MSFLQHYKSGNLVLPSALLFHYKDIFTSTDDFLVWQFFYLQNTTNRDEIATSQIAEAIGKTVPEVNRSVSHLISQELLDMKTIELEGESEVIFDATLALKKLDDLVEETIEPTASSADSGNILKDLAEDFERELGRMLSPFELEDLQKTLSDDQTDPDLIRAALREAVFNGKTNWNYIQAILRNWRREGISTLRQVEEKRQEREQASPTNVSVSDDFLSAMNLWSDSNAK
ncbi:DnaD domain-containing protein [Streptococcus macacae]|uniref:Replication initiation and membrane attachment protein, DnaB/DnaD family n=1 Tax=Streptococcus macacae NCTC 11558 TaxID=764298 RepID=G5JVP0_9STRE|nr:DnaD domain-containing protein [Streptococcus macacae]EHJ51795.1 replication initiation and membrane attachment protein, DnaB/DnaD family [Streptococcus macacae NCTC 11558]SUN78708.1 DNA replication protein DnaD [Streptococcus macacae NCTC 11558]